MIKSGILSITEILQERKEGSKGHLELMDEGRFPVVVFQYRPSDKRDVGRPMKR